MNMSLGRPVPATFYFAFFFFSFFWVCTRLGTSYELLGTSQLGKYGQILLPNVTGPESIAFDCRGRGPYVGVSDGRILMWRGPLRRWSEFAVNSPRRNRKLCDGSRDPAMEQKCGRPLGLKFNNRTCELYIADAYFGLLKVRRHGGAAEQVVSSYDGVPFKLTNGVDVDSITGEVYFTDSSRFYQRREFILAIMNGDKTGRLMKYDPRTRKVTVLLSGLSFPNGLALSKDNSFVVIAETGNFQLLKYWIRGPKAGKTEVFAELGRYPDNIKCNDKGDFWVGLNAGTGILQKEINSVKEDDIPWYTKDPVALKYDREGRVVQMMDGANAKIFESVSEVEEFRQALWVGSVVMPFVGKFKV